MYKRYGVLMPSKPDNIKPKPTNAPEMSRVNLGPIFLQIRLPKNAPMQKKHIVKVKLRDKTEASHLYSVINGVFKIDQA